MITDKYGNKKWYNKKGDLHRDDKPAIEKSNGTKVWCLNNKLHREDGPAVEKSNGTKRWYQNNKLHREDGPAIIIFDGTKRWFIEDKEYTEEEFNKIIKRRKDLARWVYQRWYSDFMRNPATERGQRYINKDYDSMMKELEVL